jgi:hypothetical protein
MNSVANAGGAESKAISGVNGIPENAAPSAVSA